MNAICEPPRSQRRDDVVRQGQAGENGELDAVGTMPPPSPIKPANRVVVHGDLGGVGDDRHVLRARRSRQSLVEKRSCDPIRVRDCVSRIARIAARSDMTIAQNRVPPKKSIRYAQQAFRDGVHQTIRYQRDPKERSDGHAAIHLEMLTDPRGKQAAQ